MNDPYADAYNIVASYTSGQTLHPDQAGRLVRVCAEMLEQHRRMIDDVLRVEAVWGEVRAALNDLHAMAWSNVAAGAGTIGPFGRDRGNRPERR